MRFELSSVNNGVALVELTHSNSIMKGKMSQYRRQQRERGETACSHFSGKGLAR